MLAGDERLGDVFARAVMDHVRFSRWKSVRFWGALAAAICKVESDWNPRAVSPAGAVGLMQIHFPYWGPRLGLKSPEELMDPYLNLRLGMFILEEALRRRRNIRLALCDYLGAQRYSYAARVLEEAFRANLIFDGEKDLV
ncbi:lytic transglycosylase domain-containing protein [Thermosulfurimonas sp. F29]|uniref:lytic transglycosylase domain-containing protein n=1 Tax=Thermosulfurimonas sp. F29 TaxID=2867247 RepID=UPI001C832E6D|nr:lytic transglycosylase domain-containing protein [Thermosulfurimonas sp. F29]MBX6423358.1 lytic transglycosylase domain-containing protein [Thermosulfurimonas sp. F29]